MAKRAQTTGQPKNKQKTAKPENNEQVEAKSPAKKPAEMTRAEREERLQRQIIRGTLIAVGITVIILLAAFVIDQVYIPGQAVASVNGENITVGDFQNRVRFERARINLEISNRITQLQSAGFDDEQINRFLTGQEPFASFINELNFPDQLGRRVLEDLINDTIIKQEISARNLTVDSAAVDVQLNRYFGFDPTQVALIGVEPTATSEPTITPTPFVSPTPTLTPTATATLTPNPEATAEVTAEVTEEATLIPTIAPAPTLTGEEVEEQFRENVDAYNNAIRQSGNVGQGDIDAFFVRSASRETLRDAIAGEIESPVLQLNLRLITLDTQEKAQDTLDALTAGESFAELASAVSTDTNSNFNGGELGWIPLELLDPTVAAVLVEAAIGDIVGPLEVNDAFQIIQVRGREERDVEDDTITQIKETVFNRWLDTFKEENAASINRSDLWLNYIPN